MSRMRITTTDGQMLGGLLVFGSIVLGSMAVLLFQMNPVNQLANQDLSSRVETAIRNGTTEQVSKDLDAAIQKDATNADLFLLRGSMLFRIGKVQESLADFDQCLALRPEAKPFLWQRGIALYYAEKYKEGKEQFEVHRTVNPNDVENAFWHFLCAAKIEGVDTASKNILTSGFDQREPLMTVQNMIAGKAKLSDVLAETESGRPATKFYGYLYLGLYADVTGATDDAKAYLEKCLATKIPGYMSDVAKVHLDLLNKKKTKPTSKP
jgi:lipoprotein NlpI